MNIRPEKTPASSISKTPAAKIHTSVTDAPGVQNAEAQILAMMNQAMVMGRNDHEYQTFSSILNAYKAGAYTAEQAITLARNVIENKQDYN